MAKAPANHEKTNFGLAKEDLEEINKETKLIIALEAKRAEINADINAKRKKIKALGIDLTAWAASKSRFHMDPEQRTEFDRSRELVDKALGIPVQADLFAGEQLDTEEGERKTPRADPLPSGPTVN